MPLTLRVPASLSNLGPGFDVIGLAVDLYNQFTFEPATGFWDQGKEVDPGENLILATAVAAGQRFGAGLPGLAVFQEEQVPRARGLGSSATARIAGFLAWAHYADTHVSRDEALAFLTEEEGHPDNVVAAVCGGLTLAATVQGGLHTQSLPVPQGLRVAVCVPDVEVSTDEARRLLPASLSRTDVVFQSQRLALLITGLLLGDFEALCLGVEDRLHTPVRGPLIGPWEAAFASARAAGGAPFISGSGSTLAAFVFGDPAPVAEALARPFKRQGTAVRCMSLSPVAEGAWTD